MLCVSLGPWWEIYHDLDFKFHVYQVQEQGKAEKWLGEDNGAEFENLIKAKN